MTTINFILFYLFCAGEELEKVKNEMHFEIKLALGSLYYKEVCFHKLKRCILKNDQIFQF